MSNEDYSVHKIVVYYKIVTTESLKSASDSDCTHSFCDSQVLHYDDTDSSQSDFMCTLIDYKARFSLSYILDNLSHVLSSTASVNFTKVLIPSSYLHNYNLDWDRMLKNFEENYDCVNDPFKRSTLHLLKRSPVNNVDITDSDLNCLDLESNAKGFDTSGSSENFKNDSQRSRFSSHRSADKRKEAPMVWEFFDFDRIVPIIKNKVYIKIYSHYKFESLSDDISTNKAGFISTTTNLVGDIDPVFFTPITKAEDKVVIDEPLSPSDRDEINEIIGKWSLTSDGKLKDIRSLLSTLQNVLLDDVEWEPMPLRLLVGDKDSIKKYYKKALLKFHPDKIGSKSPKHRFLSELIIQTLIKSWNCTA